MNINPDVAYAELSAENKYLRGRNLALAQTLFEATGERDQFREEIAALRVEVATMREQAEQAFYEQRNEEERNGPAK